MNRPEFVKDEHLKFLDLLRESGITKKQDVILAWKGAYLLVNNKQPPTIKEWAPGWFVIGNGSKKYRLSEIELMTKRLLNRVQNVQN